jgi:hypothetical protein
MCDKDERVHGVDLTDRCYVGRPPPKTTTTAPPSVTALPHAHSSLGMPAHTHPSESTVTHTTTKIEPTPHFVRQTYVPRLLNPIAPYRTMSSSFEGRDQPWLDSARGWEAGT